MIQTERVNIGGKSRPIHFSNRVAYEFERITGRPYLAAVDALIRDLQALAIRSQKEEVEDVAKDLHVAGLVDMVFAGLSYGHRVERLPVDFDVYDVSEWLLDDPDAISACVSLLIESLPMAKAEETNGAKKKATQSGSIGKRGSKPPRARA